MKAIPKKNAPLAWPKAFARTEAKRYQQYRCRAPGHLGLWSDMSSAMDDWRAHGGVVECGYFKEQK